MAGSVNKVILIGNLGKDPEVRNTQSGGKIVNLTLATSESWTDKASGERKTKSEWHKIAIFNENLANVAERYLKKGAKVYVEGALTTRKWTDQAGVDRYSTEIVLSGYNGTLTMLGDRPSGDSGGAAQDRPPPPRPAARAGAGRSQGPEWDAPAGGGRIDNDDIPFAPCWQ